MSKISSLILNTVPGWGNPASGVARNPDSSAIAINNNITQSNYSIVMGRILDTQVAYNSYEVAVEGISSPIYCIPLFPYGDNLGAVVASNTYTAGTAVLVIRMKDLSNGFILGTISAPSTTPRSVLSYSSRLNECQSAQGARILINDDDGAKSLGFQPTNAGKAIDAIDTGEFSVTSPMGTKIFLDPHMAFVAANDSTGVWVFSDDSFIRVSGNTYQQITAGNEEYFNTNKDAVEIYRGESLYTWEQLGAYTKPATFEDLVKITEDKEVFSGSPYSKYSSIDDKTRPFHHYVEFGGYLGQGKHTQVSAPGEVLSLYDKDDKLQGLSRFVQSVDGTVSIEAANGIHIIRKLAIPTAIRKTPQDEVAEDKIDKDYDTSKHSITNNPKNPSESEAYACMHTVMNILDYNAYIYNYKPLMPFEYHAKEFYVPEESELVSNNRFKPNFGELTSKQFLSMPPTVDLNITPAQKDQKYYAGFAGLSLLPDDGFNLYNSYGSEVKATGGDLILATPGDIWLKAGRRIHLWSGNDMSMRIKGNLDLSTTEGSVRIKAQKNLEMLGGNEANTGVLIESKSTTKDYNYASGGDGIQQGGIVLKSNGFIASIGSDIYSKSTSGDITFDAQRGDIETLAQNEKHYIAYENRMAFGTYPDGMTNVTYIFSQYQTCLPNRTEINGIASIKDSIHCFDDIYLNGHVISAGIQTPEMVNPMKERQLYLSERDDMEIKYAVVSTDSRCLNNETNFNMGMYKAEYLEANKIGKDSNKISFSFRTDSDLTKINVDTYLVYEDMWQSLYEGAKWKESALEITSGGKYPFPGDKYFSGGIDGYCETTYNMYDTNTGLYKNRWADNEPSEAYKNPSLGSITKTSLDNYKVI